MRRLFILVLLCAPIVAAQSDPLNSAYKPSVDCTPGDYPSNVSLTNALSKLRETADSPTSITGYGTTPLPCVTIYGTQNAFASFQANIQAPSGGYSTLSFSMSAMSKSTGPGGSYTIPAPSTSNNDIVLYREMYTDIASPDQSGHTWFDAAGYYPDALAPTIDPYWHQTTSVFPASIAANDNQSAWVDIYIPEAAPAGWYSGTITISNNSTTIATLPVLLAVWQWPASGYMPSTASLETLNFVGSNTLCIANMAYTTTSACDSGYPITTGDDVPTDTMDDLMVQLLDNRVTLSDGTNNANYSQAYVSPVETDLLKGTTTPRLNTILPGAKLGPFVFGSGIAVNATYGPTWMSAFQTNGWSTYQYLCDEPPNGCSWSTLASNATSSRSATTPIMPLLVTTDLANATANSVLNDIDWMVVHLVNMQPNGGTNQRSSYNTWLSGTGGSGYPARQIWEYDSCSPNCASGTTGQYPNYAIDQMNPSDEAMAWFAYSDNVTGDLYYLLDQCFSGTSGCHTSPWGSELSNGIYGDGNLLYPGTNSTNCSGCGGAFVGVSTPIWMPSIRLKLIRDGIQDYEYMKVLAAHGESSVVTSAYNAWISNAYCYNASATTGATVTDNTGYCPSSGSITFTGDLTDAKIAMGNAVHALTYSGSSPTATPSRGLLLQVAQLK